MIVRVPVASLPLSRYGRRIITIFGEAGRGLKIAYMFTLCIFALFSVLHAEQDSKEYSKGKALWIVGNALVLVALPASKLIPANDFDGVSFNTVGCCVIAAAPWFTVSGSDIMLDAIGTTGSKFTAARSLRLVGTVLAVAGTAAIVIGSSRHFESAYCPAPVEPGTVPGISINVGSLVVNGVSWTLGLIQGIRAIKANRD